MRVATKCCFINIGYADELGSGMRRLHYFVPRYSGKKPELIEGDIFRIIVPLDDNYSFEAGIINGQLKGNNPENGANTGANGVISGADGVDGVINGVDGAINQFSENESLILACIRNEPSISKQRISEATGIAARIVDRVISELRRREIIDRKGSNKSGVWIVSS